MDSRRAIRRRSRTRSGAMAVGVVLVLAACRGDADADVDPDTDALGAVPAAPSTTIEDYPDAVTRELARRAAELRPVEPSAVPPRHLDADQFPVALVDRNKIVSGGPPPDGIASIDEPRMVQASTVDWLGETEPVLALVYDGVARAYPAQIMIWHEIVNDTVAGVPIAVTYCPLCNSGVAFVRTIDGKPTEFGTSGALYQSNLVMYDRLTESLWTQFDGRAVIGTAVGTVLDQLSLSTISFGDFVTAHPDGEVLARDTANPRPYGRNPYNTYDQRSEPVPGFFIGEPDDTLAPFQRVIGIDGDGEAAAVRTVDVAERGVVTAEIGGTPVTIWHRSGTASALNEPVLADGEDIGATGVFVGEFDGRALTFEATDDGFVDAETGSTWNILGESTDGPLAGKRLTALPHVDTFWFSWATFQVEAVLIRPD